MQRPRPRPSILNLDPYRQGKSALAGVTEPIKLSSNESSFGPSPRAIEAYLAEAGRLHRYPDGAQAALREAIGEVHGLEPERIVCGNGSAELIDLIMRAYAGPGDQVLLSENHFELCRVFAATAGAQVVLAAERDFRTDVDALAGALTPATRLVVIANPNNPTGTCLSASELQRLHAALAPTTMLLLDGAYAEYVRRADYEAGAALVQRHENVVMTRSFSKIYGLAALRIGWAYCPAHVADVLQRIRTPFNTNAAALAAATAAVRDQAHVADVAARTERAREQLGAAIEALGLRVVPSVTNFYLIDFSDHPRLNAGAAAAHLEACGVIPRPWSAAGGRDVLRITIGRDFENAAVLDALRGYAQAAGEGAAANTGAAAAP